MSASDDVPLDAKSDGMSGLLRRLQKSEDEKVAPVAGQLVAPGDPKLADWTTFNVQNVLQFKVPHSHPRN